MDSTTFVIVYIKVEFVVAVALGFAPVLFAG